MHERKPLREPLVLVTDKRRTLPQYAQDFRKRLAKAHEQVLYHEECVYRNHAQLLSDMLLTANRSPYALVANVERQRFKHLGRKTGNV